MYRTSAFLLLLISPFENLKKRNRFLIPFALETIMNDSRECDTVRIHTNKH